MNAHCRFSLYRDVYMRRVCMHAHNGAVKMIDAANGDYSIEHR